MQHWSFVMIKTRIAVVMAFAFALSIVHASAATITSSFDTDAEGWFALDAVGHDYTANWQSSGGNPGGYLQGIETDPNGGTGYFIAPSKFLGDLSSYSGGTLSYQLDVISGTDYFSDADVIISNGSSSVSWTPNINPVGMGWYNFQVPLNEATFGSGLASILSDVTELQIRGEFITGAEVEGLDNVMLSSAVPESSTWAMLLLGFAGLALRDIAKRSGKAALGSPQRGLQHSQQKVTRNPRGLARGVFRVRLRSFCLPGILTSSRYLDAASQSGKRSA
jgi:hypothetical protein